MVILDHENLPKTRRAILIVCVLIIAIENYLSITKPEVSFGGATLSISKDDLIGGLFIGLSYLWFVAIAQYVELLDSKFLVVLKNLDKLKDDVINLKDDVINFKSLEQAKSVSELNFNKSVYYENKLNEYYSKVSGLQKIFYWFKKCNEWLFWLPIIALSWFVVFKYHGFSSAWSTITKIAF